MKFSFFFLLCLFFMNIEAQKKTYKECKVIFIDGSSKSGFCTMPNSPKDVGFFLKLGNDERNYIESEKVKRVSLINKEGNSLTFDYLENTRVNHKENSIYQDNGGKQWMYLSYYTPTMNVYVTSTEYKLDKWDKLYLTSYNNATDFAISFYLKGIDDDFPRFMVDYQDNKVSDNLFDRNLYLLFKDQPKVYQVMRGKKFGWQEINKIAELYNYLRLKAEETMRNDN